ncbi:MAG: CD3324 family protein [Desulfovibrionaceae bacterium]|nr:CD3324 family protein [Desulfovibrionaceae bacterium]
MKYRKASEVLPDELLREVQKYVSGEALYFPKYKERKKWGESTGARVYYKERNNEIREKHAAGASIEALADQYSLSVESIRKIVYQ